MPNYYSKNNKLHLVGRKLRVRNKQKKENKTAQIKTEQKQELEEISDPEKTEVEEGDNLAIVDLSKNDIKAKSTHYTNIVRLAQ